MKKALAKRVDPAEEDGENRTLLNDTTSSKRRAALFLCSVLLLVTVVFFLERARDVVRAYSNSTNLREWKVKSVSTSSNATMATKQSEISLTNKEGKSLQAAPSSTISVKETVVPRIQDPEPTVSAGATLTELVPLSKEVESSIPLNNEKNQQSLEDYLRSTLLIDKEVTGNPDCAHLVEALRSFQGTDVVELRHCHLPLNDTESLSGFCRWSKQHLDSFLPSFYSDVPSYSNSSNKVPPELVLELLEIYLTHARKCNFDTYPLEIEGTGADEMLGAAKDKILQHQKDQEHKRLDSTESEYARLVFVLVAFRDAAHLERLIEAVWMEQHIIIIHLEQSTPIEYKQQIKAIAVKYTNNVLVLEFATIVYESDTLTMVNYRIMNWLVKVVSIQPYDYHITLDGASFPLWSATELAGHLARQSRSIDPRNVWMGEVLQGGLKVDPNGEVDNLLRKRLVVSYPEGIKYTRAVYRKIPQETVDGFDPKPPSVLRMKSFMKFKTNSGNTAVYSFKIVRDLVNSPDVKELFAFGKYGCCRCMEERIWVAALGLLNQSWQEEALAHSGVLQLWGGRDSGECFPTQYNAVLDANATRCFRLEDATVDNWTMPLIIGDKLKKKSVNLMGEHIPQLLQEAKSHGFLFARKFRSDHAGSMELLQQIRQLS